MFVKLGDVIAGVVETCCQDLFAAHGVDLLFEFRETFKREVDIGVTGVIGFFSDEIRGNIALEPHDAIIEATRPSKRSSDWLGELSNQLMGRIVNKMRQYGVRAEMNTPVILRGQQFVTMVFRSPNVEMYQFKDSEGRPVVVYLDAEFDADHTVADPDDSDELLLEGQTLVF